MRRIFIGYISLADPRRFSRMRIVHLRANIAGLPDRNFECLLQTSGESRLLRRQTRRHIEHKLSPSSRPSQPRLSDLAILICANPLRFLHSREVGLGGP